MTTMGLGLSLWRGRREGIYRGLVAVKVFSKNLVLLSIEKFNSVRSDQNTLNLIQTKYRTKYLEMPAGGCFCNKVCERHSFYLLVYALLLGSIWKWVGHYVNTSINHLHQIRVNFTGEPNAHLLCHCLDCRKIGGASYSNNIVVPEDAFKLEGINAQFFQPQSPNRSFPYPTDF